MADRFWVGGNAEWNATAGTKWSATSGGAGGASVPSTGDDVFFDASSGNAIVSVSGTRVCRNFTTTNFSSLGNIVNSGAAILQIYGNVAISQNDIVFGSNSEVQFVGSGAQSFTITASPNWDCNVVINKTGTLTLLSDVNFQKLVTLTAGGLDINDFDVEFNGGFSSSNSNTRSLSLGSGVIRSQGGSWDISTTTGLTFDAETSSMEIVGDESSGFEGGGLEYYDVDFQALGDMNIGGSNTFNILSFQPSEEGVGAYLFEAGTTQTVADFVADGLNDFEIFLRSQTPGSAWNLSASSGTFNCDYLHLTDSHAGGGATWNAGGNSTNNGGNSGWLFESVGTHRMFMVF